MFGSRSRKEVPIVKTPSPVTANSSPSLHVPIFQAEGIPVDPANAESSEYETGKAMGFLSFANDVVPPTPNSSRGGAVGFLDLIDDEPLPSPHSHSHDKKVHKEKTGVTSSGSGFASRLGFKTGAIPASRSNSSSRIGSSGVRSRKDAGSAVQRSPSTSDSADLGISSGAKGFLSFLEEEDDDDGQLSARQVNPAQKKAAFGTASASATASIDTGARGFLSFIEEEDASSKTPPTKNKDKKRTIKASNKKDRPRLDSMADPSLSQQTSVTSFNDAPGTGSAMGFFAFIDDPTVGDPNVETPDSPAVIERRIRTKIAALLQAKHTAALKEGSGLSASFTPGKGRACAFGLFTEKHNTAILSSYLVAQERLMNSGRSPSKKMTMEFLSRLTNSTDPYVLEELRYPFSLSEAVVQLAAGPNCLLALTGAGEVFMTGSKEARQSLFLGADNQVDRKMTVAKLAWSKPIKKIAAGTSHFAALTEDNNLITWGQNLHTALLPSTGDTPEISKEITKYSTFGHLGHQLPNLNAKPEIVRGISGTILDIACGVSHNAVATTTGVYCWGLNLHGQLGNKLEIPIRVPTLVPGLENHKIVRVACGISHTLALSDKGIVFSWGSNEFGQLGYDTGSKKKSFSAEQVTAIQTVTVKQIACGNAHSACVGINGAVYTWGSNNFGELGRTRKSSDRGEPAPVKAFLSDTFATSISCGPFTTAACSDEGDAYVWGRLAGKHFTSHSSKPTCLLVPAARGVFAAGIVCGDMHYAILQDITLSDLGKQLAAEIAAVQGEDREAWARKTLLELRVEVSYREAIQTSGEHTTDIVLPKHLLTDLPMGTLIGLKNLTRLVLCRNYISNISGIPALTTLTELNLSDNFISSLTPAIAALASLRKANFGYNVITSLPFEIGALKELRELVLAHNKLETLVETMGQLEKLEVLDVSGNQLNTLPRHLGFITTLRSLQVEGNPLRKVPESARDDKAGILTWLKAVSAEGTKKNYRIKLMVVGDENVGKTSLLNCLRGPKQKKDTIATDGIEIHEWSENATIEGQKVPIRFDAWDFAGQDIYLITHQFFISDRAIYAIVFNPLDPNYYKVYYWLKSLQSRVKNVPVALVATHLDDKSCNQTLIESVRTKFTQLCAEFPNITTLMFISSKNEDGIKELRQKLVDIALAQSFVGEEVPNSYVRLEEEVQVARKLHNPPVITWTEWQKIAEKCGIQASALSDATHILNSMGILCYFGETNQTLKEMVILDPQWLTKAMATVISLKNTMIRDGILREADWALVWRTPDFPAKVHRPLIDLLAAFEILFELNLKTETNSAVGLDLGSTCLIPALLKSELPKDIHTVWPKYANNSLGRVIQFEFCPQGFFSRLMVRLLHMSSSPIYWQNGVIVSSNDGNAKAIVEFVPLPHPKIKLEVRGQQQAHFLRILLEVINSAIEGTFSQDALIERFVVCSHCNAKRSFQPYLFSLKSVIVALTEKKAYVYCGGYRPVLVHQLIPDFAMLDIPHIPFKEIAIEKEIGQGGFGIIYKGIYNDSVVAVKQLIINNNSDNPDEALDKFSELSTEAWFMSLLQHPNVVKLHGVSVDPFCLICEFIPFGDLYKLIKDRSRHSILTNRMVLKIAEDIAKGMKFLHSLFPAVIHRDLKSPNILLYSLTDSDPIVAKVADFGIAGVMASSMKGGGDMYSDWQPPEVQNSQEYTTSADVYGYGVILWELVMKARPFAEFSFKSVFRKRKAVLDGLRPSISSSCPDCWRQLIAECWASDPTARPTFNEVLQRLDQISEDFIAAPSVTTEDDNSLMLSGDSSRTNTNTRKTNTRRTNTNTTNTRGVTLSPDDSTEESDADLSEDVRTNPSNAKLDSQAPSPPTSPQTINAVGPAVGGLKNSFSGEVAVVSSPPIETNALGMVKNDDLRMITSKVVPPGCRFVKFLTPKVVLSSVNNPILCMLPVGTNIWGGCEDGSICVWNTLTKEYSSEMKIHTKGVTDLLLIGDTMWSASKDGSISIWELATRKHKKTLSTEAEILSLAFVQLTNTQTVWSGTRRSVYLWSVNDVKLLKEISTCGPVNSIVTVGKFVWLATDGIERWNFDTMKKQDHIFQGFPITSLVLVDNQVWASCTDGSIFVVHSNSGEYLNKLNVNLAPPIKLLAHGTFVFGGGSGSRIVMVNKKTHQLVQEIEEEMPSTITPMATISSSSTDHVQLWCGRNNKFISIWAFKDYVPAPIILKDFPNYEYTISSTSSLVFLTGPGDGIAKPGHPNRSKVTTQYTYGSTRSTLERGVENIILDCFYTEMMSQFSIIGISDGVRPGAASRAAAVASLAAAVEHLKTKLVSFKGKRPKLQELMSILFNSMKAGHRAILDIGSTTPATSDMCIGVVVKLVQENELHPSWAFVGVNLGLNKCYCWSNRTKKVTEITCLPSKGSMGIGEKGPLEVLLASTYNTDIAVVSYFYPCEDGDIIFMLSDGLHANFDPEVLRSSPSCLGFTTSNWSALAVLSPEEMQHRKQLFLEELITDLLGDANLPRAMVDRLMDFVVEVTTEKREFMEKCAALDQRKISKQARQEMRDVLKKMRGRLGHASCVAVKVGEFLSTKQRRSTPSNEEGTVLEYDSQAVGLPFGTGGLATFMQKDGYLSKMGSKLGIWQQRYFTLRENVIKIYKKPRDKKAKGEIVITANTKVLLLADEFEIVEKNGKKKKVKKPDVFVLSAGGRDYYLHALTKDEAFDWVECVNHNRSLL